ncbi:substrate-binding periplasmic protein [Roseospira goensis]|uniref:Polar amino acid transport system substrate-binding protein n=1 Tax=Roseospira goensis TaxID=391922 RepID=A0A7W6S1U0_9PROT|nr:transporter substrate-binding domain-containing protein [Roseospira goensis]MBB4287182.1 polar amino acid transport system substrate-binding protein [Roseospira goensis]
MRWVVALVFSLILVATAQAGASGTALRVATDEWPPYEYTVNGKIEGVSVAILKAVLDSMGVEIASLSVYPWSRAVTMTEAGRTDVVFSGAHIRSREETLWYPQTPLVTSQWVVFVRAADKERLRFESWADMTKGRLGVVRGYRYDDDFDLFYKRHLDFEVVNENRHNFLKLVSGRVDYVVADHRNGLFLLRVMGLEDEVHVYADRPIQETRYYAMFSKRTIGQDFVARFDAALRAFQDSERYRRLVRIAMNFPRFDAVGP